MDLNHLYHRRGVSLLMAANAACEPSRDAHRALALGYARRIAERAREWKPLAA
jgi:hypothetical protein